MPPIIAIVAGLAIVGVGTGLAVIGGISTALFTTVLLSGSSLVLSGVGTLLRGSPKLPDFSHDVQSSTVTARQAVAPRRVLIGRNRVGGVLTFIDTTGTTNEFLQLVVTLSGMQLNAITNIYLDGVALTLNGSGDCTAPAKFSGLVHVEYNLGTSAQAAFAGLVSADGAKWTSNHRQRGCAGAYVQLKWDANAFPNGVPNITFDVQGALLFDPRSSTTVYSENPALAIRDVLTNSTYGLGCATSEIDDATFITAANICDEAVTLRAGGTINRFTCNGNFETSQMPGDTLKQMLSACGGFLVFIGGKWSLYVAAYRSPTVTLTDDDFTGPLSVQTRLSKRDTCNAVKGVFVASINNWQPSDFPPFMEDSQHGYGSDQWLIEDANERIYRDITLPFTIDSAVAQRLAKIELERTRRQIQFKCKVRLTGYLLQPTDVVNVTHSRFGWSSKTFEVMTSRMTFEDNGGVPLLGVELELRETDSAIYGWIPASDELPDAAAPSTTMPNPQSVVAPTVLALSTVQTTRSDGLAATYIQVTWTAPADQFVTNGGKIFVQYRQNATSPWLTADIVDGTTTKVLIDGLIEGTAYDVRIWSQNAFGATSAVVEQDNFTLGSNTAYFTGGTIGNSTGKSLLSNGSGELNTSNTPVNASLSLNSDCSDDWYVAELSAYHTVTLEQASLGRTGRNNFFIGLKSTTVPSDNVFYGGRIYTKAKIPISIGDLIRVSGYIRRDSAAPGAGLTTLQRIGFFVFAGDGTALGELFADVTNGGVIGYTLQQVVLQVPATLGGGVPAYIRVQMASFFRNNSGAPVGLPSSYADHRYDDMKAVIQATPFDLTPTSTTGTITGGVSPLSQSGNTATVNIAASTFQFGDGQVGYNSGSVVTAGTGTYYIYADDPTYSGGAVTYVATTVGPDTVANPGRVYFGTITIVVGGGGGATGTGGGTGGGGPKGKPAL